MNDLIERQKVIEALERQKLSFAGNSQVLVGIDVAISTVYAIEPDNSRGTA